MKIAKNVFSVGFIGLACLIFSACDNEQQAEVSEQGGSNFEEQVKMEKNLMSWMESGEAVECQIQITEGKSVTMMAKDGKVRMEGVPYASMENLEEVDPENTDGVSLTVGDWFYSWSKESFEGVKFNLVEMEKMTEGMEEEQQEETGDWKDQVQDWEDGQIEYDCQEANLSDDLFEVPGNVDFVDMAESMKGFMEMGAELEKQIEGGIPSAEELKNLLPEGVEMPSM